ncbi:MAG: GMC family oxidoreductase [Myxococcota bacterium]
MAMRSTYDYVVVGAGSAGCVVAGRLARGDAQVLLVEAGGTNRIPAVTVPGKWPLLLDTEADWGFRTTPQPGLAQRRLHWPRGRILGGTGSMNAMVYIRGSKSDFDGWRELGNEGWGYDDVLPYFLASEDNHELHDRYHGRGGPLAVTTAPYRHPLTAAFLEAAQHTGLRHNPDFNGATQDGYGTYQVLAKDWARWTTADGYLTGQPQLDVMLHARTLNIIIDRGRAVGVRLFHEGAVHEVRAQREIVLCAGAIGSPQLLMLSGVGPPDHLREHGIPVAVPSPGVGGNLVDHLSVRVRWAVRASAGEWPPSAEAAEREYAEHRRGPLSSPIVEAGAFTATADGTPFQVLFLPTLGSAHDGARPSRPGFHMTGYQLLPASHGTVRLASNDPLDPPRIDPAYFSEAHDHRVAVDIVHAMRRLGAAPGLSAHVESETAPGLEAHDDAAIDTYVRTTAATLFHPVGTCKMGIDAHAVVDPQLRVRGVEGLRVADASAMPTMVSGNTNATVIMIAEKASRLILGG